MQLPKWLKPLLTVQDSIVENDFTLGASGGSNNRSDGSERHSTTDGADVSDESGLSRRFSLTDDREIHSGGEAFVDIDPVRRPIPLEDLVRGAEAREAEGHRVHVPEPDDKLPDSIEEQKACLKGIFHLPENKDIVVRDFFIGTDKPTRAMAVFIDGMSDKTIINNNILEPLMMIVHMTDEEPVKGKMDVVQSTLLPGNQVEQVDTWGKATTGVLSGSTVVFVDGCNSALTVETKGWEHRNVGVSQTEAVVRGPHDAFTESFRANTGLVRARLKSENLVTEMMTVGKMAKTDVAIMYLHGVTNVRLVEEVKKRIQAIDIDYLGDSGLLEQFIDDNPYIMVPQSLSTERPDRIANMLVEGHVAIFVGNNPYVLSVPVVFWTLMHSPEDAYLRVPFGTFIRMIRWIALAVAVFTPALYVSITNYHPEMIPTDLMLAIAGAREQVPFPVVFEVLIMEFAIELIREAGIRIPSVIGPTIGIVGALIIGQAAVQAGIVSPLLVIVVAVTALASFSIPNYNLSFATRIIRFAFLTAAALFGFYGLTIAFCCVLGRLAVQKSFGVPLFAPLTPSMDTSPDVFRRGPAYAMNERPSFMHTDKNWRQQPNTRTWKKNGKRGGKGGPTQ